MYKLVVVDLTAADVSLYEAYERKVIALLGKHGGRMDAGVRSVAGLMETHILYFPDATSFEKFLSDPKRSALQSEWQLTGATTNITDVEEINYL